MEFADSTTDVFEGAIATLNIIAKLQRRNVSNLTATARLKRGTEGTWDPVAIRIIVKNIGDSTQLGVFVLPKNNGTIHPLAQKAITVFGDAISRRKELTRLD